MSENQLTIHDRLEDIMESFELIQTFHGRQFMG